MVSLNTTFPNSNSFRIDEVGQQQHKLNVIHLGVLIAGCLISGWAISLVTLLSSNLQHVPTWLIAIAILCQTFLYTGLFITAHDAMHGSVAPGYPTMNAFFGRLTVLAYGLFSYRQLLQKHWLHHHHPASDRDPDYHNGKRTNPIAWYCHFMQGYWSWRQLVGFVLIFLCARTLLQIHEINLMLFWVVPSILSSIQLFYFGTFLPHRQPEGGYTNSHRAQTNSLPTFLSFITCYHFGYHEEHHEYPHVPWWQLPIIHQSRLRSA